MLDHAKEHAAYPWIYPLIGMAAHTGARRSDLIRMQVTAVDFEGGSVTVREKKRVWDKRSTRQAPLTPLPKEALQTWLAVHPRQHALLLCRRRRAEQETQPHDRPSVRDGDAGGRRALGP